jgi:aminopeptidase N
VERTFGQTTDMLDFFSDVTGTKYPYDKYDQVVVQNFIYGGMENTTATVLVNSVLLSEGAALTRDSQGLIAHELAHMWWGDMLTCREWPQMWLNEGFATYFQKLYRQHADGDDWFIYEMDDAHREVLAADRNDPRPVVVDFFNRRDERNNANIYVKGASVLDMLREYVGDEVFRDAIARYGRDNQWRTVETEDLMRAFRDASGENLDWFFEQWVYLSGHPDLRVTKQWDEPHKLLTLTVEQTQQVTDQVPLFRLPLTVEFTPGLLAGRRRARRMSRCSTRSSSTSSARTSTSACPASRRWCCSTRAGTRSRHSTSSAAAVSCSTSSTLATPGGGSRPPVRWASWALTMKLPRRWGRCCWMSRCSGGCARSARWRWQRTPAPWLSGRCSMG